MKIIRWDFSQTKGIPPTGLCVGVHRAGVMHMKNVEKHGDGLAVWSLRPELDFLAFRKEGLGENGIRTTNDIESIEKDEKLIIGVRGAPPEIRKKAEELGLKLLADATCPFVLQQEEATEELLREGYNLVLLSSGTHHGITRLLGIAKEVGRELYIVEREEDVDKIRLTRFQPVGVIVQTTFWSETYKKIMARLLDRFGNVRIKNTACVDALGITRLLGIAKEVGRELYIVEREEDVDKIRLTRFQPVGVIVQTTFWSETYKKIMARLLDRFGNVRIKNTACVDALQRLPEVEKLAKQVDIIVIVGWTEGMTNRMLEVARAFNPCAYKLEKVDQLERKWFQGKEKVGVIGANETPGWMLDEVVERINSMDA